MTRMSLVPTHSLENGGLPSSQTRIIEPLPSDRNAHLIKDQHSDPWTPCADSMGVSHVPSTAASRLRDIWSSEESGLV